MYVPSDRVGTHVTAGQPLFRVDDRHLKAQLKVAEAQLAMAEARLAKLELQPRPEELPPSLAKVKSRRGQRGPFAGSVRAGQAPDRDAGHHRGGVRDPAAGV